MPSPRQIRRGRSTITASTGGNATIAHGLRRPPRFAQARLTGDSANQCTVQSVDATNLTVRVYAAAGTDVTSGSFDIDWMASM